VVPTPACGCCPLFAGDFDPVGGDVAVSFLDLIDVFVAGQLREHGVALQTVRRVYQRMGKDLNTPHPFSRQELLSDGKAVFMRGLDAAGEEELVEVLTRQRVFPQIILPFLKQIDYDHLTILARRWRVAESVVIDPGICLGKPIVAEAGIATAVLASAYEANGRNADCVADWYSAWPEQVLAAVKFERGLAA
jgi:uncharacterized protein (DUF433 family)